MKSHFQPFFELCRIRRATVCAFVMVLVAYHPIAGAQQAEGAAAPPPLVVFAAYEAGASPPALSADGAATLETIRSDPAASGIRIGHSVPAAIAAALDARVLSIVVPSTPEASASAADAVIAFTGVDVEYNDEDLVSLYAQDDATDSEVALVVQGPDVLGSVRLGAEVYKVHPLGDGLTAVYHYDTSQLREHPPNWGEFMLENESMHRQAPDAPPREDTKPSGAAADTGDVIDILVAYTPAARTAAGNIDAFVQFAIDNTHRIYANSRIGFRLRLVHKYQTSYHEHSDMSTDLRRLTATSDTTINGERWDPGGDMDEVHGLRDRYGADLVALIVGRNTETACGVGWMPDFGKYPDIDYSFLGMSVTAENCETTTHHTFAHELGHNQGANHDPDNTCESPPCTLPPSPTFPYRYGRCNTAEGWNTIMSYASNTQGDCRREIEYFSSPILNYRGTQTGDARIRDNRRVLNETAYRVANYRQSVTQQPRSHTLPLVTPASNPGQQGFVRIINNSSQAGTVRIYAIDDTGRRFGPISLSLDATAAAHFNSQDLESGNAAKGLSGRAGNGSGNWRLELETELNIEPLAYIRTPDGFVTNMHEVAAETEEGSNRYHVPFFNPGKNIEQQSWLRLINPGDRTATITIRGQDDRGDAPRGGNVRLTLPAGEARRLTARQLEQGDRGFSGRFEAGTGKWRLWVSADRPIQVMSLLQLPTGHLTNLSRGQAGSSVGTPPPPGNEPDLVVQSPSVSNSSPNAGQIFTLSVTVRNQGDDRSAATTLRYYRSSDAAISTADTEVGTDAVGGLSASGTSNESIDLIAPSIAGTYYYGACVDSVSGESNPRNNCSSAIGVTVGGPVQNLWGAIAAGWNDRNDCSRGSGWNWGTDYGDRSSVESAVLSACQSRGLHDCEVLATFSHCGSLARGSSASSCYMAGGYGTTSSAAEQSALSFCQKGGYDNCRILVDGATGRKATYCNSNARTGPPADAQSGSTRDFLLGALNPGSQSQDRYDTGKEVMEGMGTSLK